MRFADIRSQFITKLRWGTMLVRSPLTFARYRGSIFLRRRVGDAEIPGTGSDRKNRKKNKTTRVQERLGRFGASFGQRFKGSEEEQTTLAYRDRPPEYRRRPQDLAFETDRRIRPTSSDTLVIEPSTEEIPALVPSNEIRGRNGRYRCIKEAIVVEEKYRIYPGVHTSTNKPVVIKEYLLPEIKYNRQERRICKKRFASIVDIDLKSIGGQDFRVVFPLETISPPREKRCYLVTESIDENITLKQYLEKEGALSPKQVVKLLDQVLQTLWFIHTNRLRLSSSEVQNGIAHGNLSLNSILVDVEEPQSEDDEPQLMVYLSDLALWEHIFVPPNAPVPETSPLQDLKDLGSVSASLLIGKTETDDKNWFLASEDEEDNWLAKDEVLGRFILRLLGISSKFESALVARQELLQLEREGAFDYQQELQPPVESEPNEGNRNNRRKLKIAAITALVLFLIGWAFVFLNGRISRTTADESVPCCIAKVKPPEGNYDYAAENGIWSYVLEKSGFTSQSKNLREELEARQPILEDYNYEGADDSIFAKLNIGSIDFALGYWHDDLPDDLEQEVVAFHGLATFVAFSDDFRPESIPRDLRGKISIKDLRTLYTKGADDWRLPRKLRDWEVKLYVPFEREAIALLKDLLFPDGESSAAERRQFDKTTEEILARQYKEIPAPKNYSPTTRSVVANVFLDYENNKTIGIGFGYFNSVFGQCAVYPLAIAQGRRAIQPYATSEGEPITPRIDLCNDKGGYILDASEFNSQKYPLSQKLVVIYPEDEKRSQAGRKFAKLLKTKESQYFLEEAGIVPLQN